MRPYSSGSCRRSQSSFGAVKPVSARLPVNSTSRAKPTRSSISAHSAAVRWSFHRIAGRNTRWSASRTTSPCICPDSPTGPSGNLPRTSPAARHQPSGSCSDHPGCGLESGYSALAVASTRPSPSMATPLTAVVPTSRPTRATSGAERGVYELVGPDGVLGLLGPTQLGLVDLRGDPVDELPLEHRALYSPDRVLGVGVEVEAEPLPILAVVGAPYLDRELERLHEGGGADHVVVV